MRSVKLNFAASVAGRAATALSLIAFVPVYLRLIGVEAYGIVGIFTALQSVLLIVDLGLSSTLTRELARSAESPDADTQQHAANLVVTLEVMFWALAAIAAAAIVLCAPAVEHWIKGGALPPAVVAQSVMFMAPAVALQLPFVLYQGALLGLQRHVELNIIVGVTAVIRGLFTVAALRVAGATLITFFVAQAVVSFAQVWLLRYVARRGTRQVLRTAQPRFDMASLRRTASYTITLAAITGTSAILIQLDKLVLSRVGTLRDLGYYTLAGVLAQSMFAISAPMFAAVFPRFTSLLTALRPNDITRLYERATEALATLLAPIAVTMTLFPEEILRLWTNDPSIAANSAPLLRMLAAGSFILATLSVPFALQLAHGWTSLSLSLNLAQLTAYLPALFFIIARFGARGAAAAWCFLNLSALVIMPPIVHRRLHVSRLTRWYASIALPIVTCGLAGIILRRLMPSIPNHRGHALLQLGVTVTILFLVAAAVMPSAASFLKNALTANTIDRSASK